MENRYSNGEREVNGGETEYRCDVCLKWHKTGYGFEIAIDYPFTIYRLRKKLCNKCAKEYRETLDEIIDLLEEKRQEIEEF